MIVVSIQSRGSAAATMWIPLVLRALKHHFRNAGITVAISPLIAVSLYTLHRSYSISIQ